MSNKLENSQSSIVNPGPGSYNLPNSIKTQQSSSKQNQQKRFKPYETLVPGPGQYNASSENSSNNGPKAIILSRKKQQKIDAIPGPGSYQPDFNKIYKSQSGHHLPKGQRSSIDEKIKVFTPGPGTYETAKSTLLRDKNAIGFGPERKFQLSNQNNVPGPGKYNTLNTMMIMSNAPQPIFGKGLRSHSYKTLAPGPGAYKLSGDFTQNLKKGFSISFKNQSAFASSSKKNLPGPGAYQLDEIDKIKFKSSSFSMPKSSRLKIENQKQILLIPGPQKYDIKQSTFDHMSFKLGKSTRKGLQNVSITPGPGTYSSNDNLKQMPKFSVPKSNKSWIKTSDVPGPGNYDPKNVFSTQYQSIGINKDERKPFYDQKKGIPGPGKYKIPEMESENGGYKLGHSKRSDLANSRQKVPGPGEYNIKSRLIGAKGN